MTVLAVEQVTKTYDMGGQPVHALRGVDLTLEGGEVLLLLGPSGSGKTTLLSIMGCILQATSGRVLVDGGDVTRMSEAQLPAIRLRHFGFVFQGFNLFPALTATENVEIALGLKGISGRAARQAAREALDAVGLADKADVLPSNLSGGQKQRVAIARALAGQPSIILADEPTAALDSTSGQLVMDLLRSLATEHHRAVVIVTHDSRTFQYADRIVTIEDGRLAATNDTHTVPMADPAHAWQPRSFQGVRS